MKSERDNPAGHGNERPVAGEPVVLSSSYRAALASVEALPSNQDCTDKSWVFRALDDAHRHFAKARKV